MTGLSDDRTEAPDLPVEIAPDMLATLRLEGKPHTVLDVREGWELEICKLRDCLHIPLGDLPQRVSELPNDRPVVVVCHSGRRSLMATRFLRGAGVGLATNLRGGVDAWAIEVDSDMPRY